MSALISSAVPRHVASCSPSPRMAASLAGPVERHPAHELRRHVVLGLAPRLPDALVGLAPHRGGARGLGLDERPQPRGRRSLRRVWSRIESSTAPYTSFCRWFAGTVADAHGPGPGVAGQVVAGRLGQVAPAVDPVHDLQAAVVDRLELGDELDELVGLPVEVEEVQRLQRERRVAHPRVAVVPVALAARGLGQRRGQRGDGGARGHVRQALDRQGRPLDRMAVGVVDGPRPTQPVPPEAGGGGEAGDGVVTVGGGGEAVGPRQRAVHALARPQDVAGPDPAALDAERHVGAKADGLAGARGLCAVAVAVRQRPRCAGAAVVEHRLADELDLDLSVDALGHPDEEVVGVVVRRRSGVRRDRVLAVVGAHREGVVDHEPPAWRVPRRAEDVRPRLVGPGRRHVDAEGPEAEVPRLAVEQGAEQAGRVEAGDAQPADRAVGSDKRARVAVGEEGVVLDRRERRRHRRALAARVEMGVCAAHGISQGVCHRPKPETRASAAAGPHEPCG